MSTIAETPLGRGAPGDLTLEEAERLSWRQATWAARVHLRQAGLDPTPDAARHLAYGLWLKATGRLDAEFAMRSTP